MGGLFCAAHQRAVEEATIRAPRSGLGDLLAAILTGKPIDTRKVAQAGAEVLGAFVAGMGSAAAAGQPQQPFSPFSPFTPFHGFTNPPFPGQAQARRAPAQPPPPMVDPQVVAARATLGLPAWPQPITKDDIKKRQRELAKKFHPDRHPDKTKWATERMAAITGAAARLLEDV